MSGPAHRYGRTRVLDRDEKIEAVFTDPQIYKTADLIPDCPGKCRPRKYPAVMAVFYSALVPICGSHAAVDAALAANADKP